MEQAMNEDVSNLTLSKTFRFQSVGKGESAIANLIEAAELLRRNKIETNRSFSDAFFSSIKQYID